MFVALSVNFNTIYDCLKFYVLLPNCYTLLYGA